MTTTKSTDECILCGKNTKVPKDTPIYLRDYYVKGSGPICKECNKLIFGKDK